MAKDPVCPIYYNDLLGSTRDWTDEEFGAYVRLLLEQWDKKVIPNPYQSSTKTLPDNLPDFSRLLRICTSADKHWPLLSDKFKTVDGGLQNENMEFIREKRIRFKEKQKGNVLKRYQTSTKPPTKTLPLEEENENEKEKVKENGFEVFWKAYPKKKSKGQAEKAWKQANIKNGMLEIMLAKIDILKKSKDWLKDGGQFIPYPATWINAKGWEDEVEQASGVAAETYAQRTARLKMEDSGR